MAQDKQVTKRKHREHKSRKQELGEHYTRWMHADVTVKHEAASRGQKRVIFRALREAHQLGAGERTMVAAVACMTQESLCQSIRFGDLAGPDSRGPYQQRSFWGPILTRLSASGSTRLFLLGGDTGEPGWNHYWSLPDGPPSDESIGNAVNRVQVSIGDYYDQWVSEAEHTVSLWLAEMKDFLR